MSKKDAEKALHKYERACIEGGGAWPPWVAVLKAIIEALPEEDVVPFEEVADQYPTIKSVLQAGPEPVDERTTQPTSAQVLVPREIWIHKDFRMWTETGGPYDADYESSGWRKILAWPLIEPSATVILGQHSAGTAAPSAEAQQPKECECTWKPGIRHSIGEEDARKLRIMKAMEVIAAKTPGANFQIREGVWEAFGANWSRTVNHYSELGEPEEQLWEGEISVCGESATSAQPFGVLSGGWRRIKVREVRE